MATFGNEAAPTGYRLLSRDTIHGTVFPCTEVGKADNISLTFRMNTIAENLLVKCALYKHSDLSFVGLTPGVLCAATTTYKTFNFPFSVRPDLIATDYIIVGFFNFGVDSIRFGRTVNGADATHYQDLAYDGFPNPLVPTHISNVAYCIHCDYTPSAPPSPGAGIGNPSFLLFPSLLLRVKKRRRRKRILSILIE